MSPLTMRIIFPHVVWHSEEQCNFKGPYQAEVVSMYPGLSQVLTKSFSHQIHLAKHVDDCRLSYVAQATRDMKDR